MMLLVSSSSVLDVGMVSGPFNWILRGHLCHTFTKQGPMERTQSTMDFCQNWQLYYSHKIMSCVPHPMDNFVGVYWCKGTLCTTTTRYWSLEGTKWLSTCFSQYNWLIIWYQTVPFKWKVLLWIWLINPLMRDAVDDTEQSESQLLLL